MTISPGPMIASGVNSRVLTVRLTSVSATRIRPNAPSMSPRCAASSTADGRETTARFAVGGSPPGVGFGAESACPRAALGSVMTRSRLCADVGDLARGCVADRAWVGFAPPPVVGDGGLENVIESDHAENAVAVIDDRDGDQVVVSHQ